MKETIDGLSRFKLRSERQRGVVFAALCAVIFGVLLLVERPHWAGPWFVASLFTFVAWRLSRSSSRAGRSALPQGHAPR